MCVNGPLSPDKLLDFFKGERGTVGGRGQPGLTGLKGAKVRQPLRGRIQLEKNSRVPFKPVVGADLLPVLPKHGEVLFLSVWLFSVLPDSHQ